MCKQAINEMHLIICCICWTNVDQYVGKHVNDSCGSFETDQITLPFSGCLYLLVCHEKNFMGEGIGLLCEQNMDFGSGNYFHISENLTTIIFKNTFMLNNIRGIMFLNTIKYNLMLIKYIMQ